MTQNKNMIQNSLKIIRKRKEKEGGKRGEKKKRLLTLIIFVIPTKKKHSLHIGSDASTEEDRFQKSR